MSREAAGELRGIVHTDDGLIRGRCMSRHLQGGKLGFGLHPFLPDLDDVHTTRKCRGEEVLEVTLRSRASVHR